LLVLFWAENVVIGLFQLDTSRNPLMAVDEVGAGLVTVRLAIGDEAPLGLWRLVGQWLARGLCYAGAGLPLSQTRRLML
jgi:hypothetical protein